MHTNHVAHRYSLYYVLSIVSPKVILTGTARGRILRLIRQTCIPNLSTLLTGSEVKIFATKLRDIRGLVAQRDTSSSISDFPANTILLQGHLSTSLYKVAISRRRNTRPARHYATRFTLMCTILETWSAKII